MKQEIMNMRLNDGTAISLEDLTESLQAEDAVYVMLADGEKIAGRNDKDGWKLLATRLDEPLNLYSVQITFPNHPNREVGFSIDSTAFYGMVNQKLAA